MARDYTGLFIESRYGSNAMTKEDWFDMLRDMAGKGMNFAMISLYGCWVVQYSGKVSEFLYVPIQGRPELRTPMEKRYIDPDSGALVNEEYLPPMFEQDFFGELCAYGKSLGITVMPLWNSFGHNTLLPAKIPEISSKNEKGEPELTGFCTADPKTYEVLFDCYDQIIDRYLKPNGLTGFCIGMDEVEEDMGYNAKDPQRLRNPWCQCEICRKRSKKEIMTDHVLKLVQHLKDKGMDTVCMYGDMLTEKRNQNIPGLAASLREGLAEKGLTDEMMLCWWGYRVPEQMYFDELPRAGGRNMAMPWTGYYTWSVHTAPLRNIEFHGRMAEKDGAAALVAYSSYDKSYDRMYEAVAAYGLRPGETGNDEAVTREYVRKHFPGQEAEAFHAYRLVDRICREETGRGHVPMGSQRIAYLKDSCVCFYDLLVNLLSYYPYTYCNRNREWPRRFPGEALDQMLLSPEAFLLALEELRDRGQEARECFEKLAEQPGADKAAALRMAYECENYECLAADWKTLLWLTQLKEAGSSQGALELIGSRRAARLQLMKHLKERKEAYWYESAAMRNHSIFLALFEDAERIVRESGELPDLRHFREQAGETFRSLL